MFSLYWVLPVAAFFGGLTTAALLSGRRKRPGEKGPSSSGGRAEQFLAELRNLLPVLRENLRDAVRQSEKGVLEAARAAGEVNERVRAGLGRLNTLVREQQKVREKQEAGFAETYQKIAGGFRELGSKLKAMESVHALLSGMEREARSKKFTAVLE
ncbi:MAG: hypothetical protein ACUVSK_13765, partial [Desulfotomaculales bacterium]